MRNLILFISCIYLLSCGGNNEKPQGKILAVEKMEEVMWDVFQADAFTERYIKIDSTKNAKLQNAALQEKIFELHKINREDFYTSYDYYTARPDQMKMMLDTITARAERKRNQVMSDRYSGKKAVE